MHFVQYLTVGFAALAVADPISRRTSRDVTADTIIADIGVIQQKTNELTATTEPYQGGKGSLGEALEISKKGDEVSKAIKQAIKDAEDVAPFTDEEAINVGIAVSNLNPDVIKTLDTFKSKRQAFDNHYHLSPVVRHTLEDQKEITVELGDAIIAKVPEDLKEAARQISQPVLDKFDEVIAVYSS